MSNNCNLSLVVSKNSAATPEQTSIAKAIGASIDNSDNIPEHTTSIICEECFMTGDVPLAIIEKSYLLLDGSSDWIFRYEGGRWEFFLTCLNLARHSFLIDRNAFDIFHGIIPDKASWLGFALEGQQKTKTKIISQNKKVLYIENKGHENTVNLFSILKKTFPQIDFIKLTKEDLGGKNKIDDLYISLDFSSRNTSGFESAFIAGHGIVSIGEKSLFAQREIFPATSFNLPYEYNAFLTIFKRLLFSPSYFEFIREKAGVTLAESFSKTSVRQRFFNIHNNLKERDRDENSNFAGNY